MSDWSSDVCSSDLVKVQTGDDKTESAKPDSVRQPDAGRVPAEQTE